MEKKTFQNVPPAIREAYNRANRTRDLETQIALLRDAVKEEPAFVNAREKLRALERRKSLTVGVFTKLAAQIGSGFKLAKIKALAGKDPLAAMALCEDVLARSLDNVPVLNALADAAKNADAMFIAVEALSLIREMHPKNEANAWKLARCMQDNNQAKEALKIIQGIAAKYPNDMNTQSELRAALALASMEKGKWEEAGSTQEKTVDAKSFAAQQLSEGTIHDADQAKLLVAKFREDLEKNDSIDIRRKLADAYMIMEDYDAAISELEKIAETIGTMDPLLDKSIEDAVVGRYNKQIKEIRQNPDAGGDAERRIAEIEAMRDAYRLQRAQARIENYPNDAQLNFELAELLFSCGRVSDSIPYFQSARRSPQRRLASMVYLGRCFAANKQYDMAVEQFEGALAEMNRMDKAKLETLYYLATTLEESGDMKNAVEKYKEIYQNQANFMDVSDRIEQYYQRQKQNTSASGTDRL